jgi:hypothetical protein
VRVLNFLVLASVGLALLQGAAKILVLLAIIAALVAFIARPQESLGCAVIFVLVGLVGRYPIAGLVIIGLVALVSLLKHRRKGLGSS